MRENIYRTHNCGELRLSDVGKTVRLAGFVDTIRKLGSITFVTLRDHYGITQLLINDDSLLNSVTKESTISVIGKVLERQSKNPKMETGDIEIEVSSLTLLGKCTSSLPFEINDSLNTKEELRLKYRYLDLRNPEVHKIMVMRAKMLNYARNKLTDMGFVEFQTPILTSSSPEGARDFLVPTVKAPGEFYALPQAPQQFKQLLMVSGFDKYFQIAPCFRDEAARSDRTPGEFYQVDMEMSFATQEDVFSVCEEFASELFEKLTTFDVSKPPFVRIPYREAMEKYCSDKPDLRNPLTVKDLTKLFENSTFNAFKGKTVKATCVNAGEQSRKWYDELGQVIVNYEGKGMAYVKYIDNEFTGGIAKFLTDDDKQYLIKAFNLLGGESICMVADTEEMAVKLANVLRNELGNRLNLIDKNKVAICWIVDFPFFEKNKDTGKIDFSHIPFTMPQGGMEAFNNKNPYDILAWQFDMVINGHECLSGAVRNHDQDIMVKAFEMVGYDKEVVKQKFGALYNAFTFGAPPHAGCAFGFDTLLMIVCGKELMREVITFPMNKNARDILMGAPNKIDEKTLAELGIKLLDKENK